MKEATLTCFGRAVFSVCLGLFISFVSSPVLAEDIVLTPAEKAWLQSHPVIRVGVDVAWAPIEYLDKNGRLQGISADYLALLGERLGVRFEAATHLNWQETLQAVQQGDVDMLSSVKPTPERETYLQFSDTYISMPIMVFAGPDSPFIQDMSELAGRRVAVVDGYAIQDILARNHPAIMLVPARTVEEALRSLAQGRVDAFVGNLVTTTFALSELGFTQIKVSGETPYSNDQSMAVGKHNVELASILNKALNAIDAPAHNSIVRRWLSVRYERVVAYGALLRYLGGGVLIVLLVLLWNRTLRQRVAARTRQFEDELKRREESEKRFSTLFENAPDAIVVFDCETGFLIAANGNAERLFGLPRQQLIDKSPWDLSPETQPSGESSKMLAQAMVDRALSGEVAVFEWTHLSASGSEILCEVRLVRVPHTEGRHLQGSIIDISARKQAEADTQLAAGVFDNATEGIFVTDENAKIIRVNQAFTQITGYTPEEALGQNPRMFRSGEHDNDFYDAFWKTVKTDGAWQGEIINRKKNGQLFPAWQNVSAVRDAQGNCVQYISIFADITDKKQTEEQLRKLAHYDVLTGLPNRLLFNERLERALTRRNRLQNLLALLFLDLDHFKNINDSLGHPAGDDVLCGVASRLSEVLRASDTVARLGGDEFVVLLDDLQDPSDAVAAAEKVLNAMAEPFDVAGQLLSVTTSIGISLANDKDIDAATLVKNADSALYHAKQSGRNHHQFYTPDLTTAALERMTLGSELRRAIDRNEFEVWYQPQWQLGNNGFFAAEALVRWRHPERGLVMPLSFIPIAEEQGLIEAIGNQVLETACADLRGWLDAGLWLDNVAVNVSGQQLCHTSILATVERVLTKNRLQPNQLELEITESTIMSRTAQTISLMDSLKALGVRISVDDFGTGYSSLSYLKRLPIDKLKIDRSFVMDIPSDSSDMAIVRAIIALGRSLNLRVLAEGVETIEQQQFLKEEGCDEAQGYLVGKPMPAAEFEALLRQPAGRVVNL